MILAGSLMKSAEAAARTKDRVPNTEKVERHPIALIKIMERDDMPQPTKFPHCRIEFAVARFSSGKYSESSEKERGLKAAAMMPRRTRLRARNPKESRVLTRPIVVPEAAMAKASIIFLLTKGVARP